MLYMAEIFIVAPLNIILSILSVLLNSVIISHFFSQRTKLIPYLFLSIAIADSLCAIGLIIQSSAVIGFCGAVEPWNDDTNGRFCEGSSDDKDVNRLAMAFLMYIILGVYPYLCSVFFNLLLVFTRTLHLSLPFRSIDGKSVKVVAAGFAIVWALVAIVDWVGFLRILMDTEAPFHLLTLRSIIMDLIEAPVIGTFILALFGADSTENNQIVSTVYSAVFYIAPVLIVAVCTPIQIRALLSSSSESDGTADTPLARESRRASITIVILASIFCICNSAMSILFLYYMIESDVWNMIGKRYRILIPIASTTLPILSATLCPLVIISRSNALRDDLKEVASRVGVLLRGWVERMRIETQQLEADTREVRGEPGEVGGAGEVGEATPLLQ